MLDEALQAFEYAKNKGYNKKALYDYAISVAAQAQKNDVVYALAAEGYKYYGKEDPKFIQLIINGYIEKQDYEQANAMLDEAIAAEPGNAVYYNLKGVICESQKDNETALEFYKKATEIDATLASAHYNYGRKLCEKAYSISDSSAELSQAEYNKVRAEQIDPLLKLAAEQLEKAFQLDEENQRDALRYLRNVYYNLGDDENLKRVELM
jgi:Tfp pilus assembly protein PilF